MKQIKDKLNDLLKFLNLSDFSGNISITNVALVALLGKVALSPSLLSVIALGFIVVSYMHKRYEASKLELSAKEERVWQDHDVRIKVLAQAIVDLQNANQDIRDQAEQTKKLLSTNSFAGIYKK